ncbi:MAG: hypothetical protein J7J85_00195 [Deltaproteobacteria bacterium]|nr:hypothetical protein [Deltaproteobacteria bacterium]
MRIIKKYKNRIMYDTKAAMPVTLHQLADMMKNRIRFKILDNTSGRDITVLTILQILIEVEKSGKGIRNIVPELIAWSLKASRTELRRMIKDMLGQGLTLERDHRLLEHIKDITKPDQAMKKRKDEMLKQEITSKLNEFYEELLLAIERLLEEKFGYLRSLEYDSSDKP